MNVLMVTLLVLFTGVGDDLRGWRVDGSGRQPDIKAPTKINAKKQVWRTPLPAPSAGGMLMMGNKLLLTAEPATLICVDAGSGEVLWQAGNTYKNIIGPEERERMMARSQAERAKVRSDLERVSKQLKGLMERIAAAGRREKKGLRQSIPPIRNRLRRLQERMTELDPLALPRKHPIAGFSGTTPAGDGKMVVAAFGNGVVSAYTLEGRRIWAEIIQKPGPDGHGASPAISGDTVVVHFRDLIALDKLTGKELWRVKSDVSLGSPQIIEIGGEAAVLTAASGDLIRLADGKAIYTGDRGLDRATPVVDGGQVFYMDRRAQVFPLPAVLERGPAPEPLWEVDLEGDAVHASSVVTADWVYTLTSDGQLYILERAGGRVLDRANLAPSEGGTFHASLALAGKRLYAASSAGDLIVFKRGKRFRQVSRTRLEPMYEAPLFSNGRIYLRGESHLYCYRR